MLSIQRTGADLCGHEDDAEKFLPETGVCDIGDLTTALWTGIL
jgi:hypothetical protein